MLHGAFPADADGSPELRPLDDPMPSSEDGFSDASYEPEPEPGGHSMAQAAHGTTAIVPETSGPSVPDDGDSDGMLPRDKQRRTAFYDYTAEKQMSHRGQTVLPAPPARDAAWRLAGW